MFNLRFKPKLFYALRDEANRQNISIAVLVNRILLKHFNFDQE